jgi:hypothetical protein
VYHKRRMFSKLFRCVEYAKKTLQSIATSHQIEISQICKTVGALSQFEMATQSIDRSCHSKLNTKDS